MPSTNDTDSDTIQVVLAPYDRVAIGGELLLFKWRALETPGAGPIPTAEEAVMEFKRAIQVTGSRVVAIKLLPHESPCLQLFTTKIRIFHVRLPRYFV